MLSDSLSTIAMSHKHFGICGSSV